MTHPELRRTLFDLGYSDAEKGLRPGGVSVTPPHLYEAYEEGFSAYGREHCQGDG